MELVSYFVGDKCIECTWVTKLQQLFPYLNSFRYPDLTASHVKTWPPSMEDDNFTSVQAINESAYLSIEGYRQSVGYFEKHASKVRTALKLAPEVETQARTLIHGVGRGIKVGVHVRIGDLLRFDRVEFGYQVANESFYRAAFEKIMSLLSEKGAQDVTFLVATDTLNITKKLLNPLNSKYHIVYLSGTEESDFAVLTLCDHSITSGGTFGFWGSWLANGYTVYFSETAKPGSKLAAGFHNSLFYPSDWVPVP